MTTLHEVDDDLRRRVEASDGELGPFRTSVETVAVPAADGTALVTDVHHPLGADGDVPVILIRTPYGRRTESVRAPGVFFASHGFRTVIQDCRGTTSFFHEASDGAATAEWIAGRPWWAGALYLHGGSYHGFTAWATASERPEGLRALSVQIYGTDRTSAWFPGGSFALSLTLPWSELQASTDGTRSTSIPEVPAAAYAHLPLLTADEAAFGRELPFYRELATSSAKDPRWRPLTFTAAADDLDVPVLLIDGWYDYQRIPLWNDYLRLDPRTAPRRIVIGPWGHLTMDQKAVNREALDWFLRAEARHRGQEPAAAGRSSRFYLTPDHGWHEYGDPEVGATRLALHLADGSRLQPEPQERDASAAFTYDPHDPTPAFGLDAFGDLSRSGPIDNRELEARADVLTFTTSELDRPLDVVGAVDVVVYVTSSAPSADVFARLTDVHPDGRSVNVVDALVRLDDVVLDDPERPFRLELPLGPAAHRFAAGHRLRLQLSSGAHPAYARNLGIAGPQAAESIGRVARQTVRFGGETPSRIVVPIREEAG